MLMLNTCKKATKVVAAGDRNSCSCNNIQEKRAIHTCLKFKKKKDGMSVCYMLTTLNMDLFFFLLHYKQKQ